MIDLPNGAKVTVHPPDIPRAVATLPDQQSIVTVRTFIGAPPVAGYVWAQSTPSASWVIPHGLAVRWPHVTVVLAGDTEPVYPDMTHPSPGVTNITFPSAQSGTAYLS